MHKLVLAGCAACWLISASATERFFTYTYEPETLPRGAFEYEQWITARVGRTAAVGQDQFNRWEFRHELEYGVTDNYTASVYFNHSLTDFHNTQMGEHVSHYQFDSISLDNRLLVLNPAGHSVGLALYREPGICEHDAAPEAEVTLGQRGRRRHWGRN